MDNKLSVRLYGTPIGVLEKTSEGKLHFSYKQEILESLSFSLPAKEKTFDNMSCQAYFGGLLPTSEVLREQLASQYNFLSKDTFAFLAHFGRECLGAVSFHAYPEPVNFEGDVFLKARILSGQDLKSALSAVGVEPLFYRYYEQYPLLSGNSIKAAICFLQNKIAVPINSSFSTHILRLSKNEDELLNQYYCLKMARYAGLKVPEFHLQKIADTFALVIARYDREIIGKRVRKYHQEDTCQALAIRSTRRYQRDKGPSFKDLFSIVNHSQIPALDRHCLIKGILFNYIINNTKAHAKHFAFLRRRPHSFILAPFNGLYSDYEHKEPLAMLIGTKVTMEEVMAEDWQLFCQQIGYTAPLFKTFRKEYIPLFERAALQSLQDFKSEGLSLHVAEQITQFVRQNGQRMR